MSRTPLDEATALLLAEFKTAFLRRRTAVEVLLPEERERFLALLLAETTFMAMTLGILAQGSEENYRASVTAIGAALIAKYPSAAAEVQFVKDLAAAEAKANA
jgi:hypothetical protein